MLLTDRRVAGTVTPMRCYHTNHNDGHSAFGLEIDPSARADIDIKTQPANLVTIALVTHRANPDVDLMTFTYPYLAEY